MLQAPAIQLPKENISVFTQRARKHYLFFMCVLNVFNFTNVKLHLLQRNCSWLPQYSCNIKLFCFMSLALLIQLPQTEKSENLIKTEFLRDSASSFHRLSSSIFSCSFVCLVVRPASVTSPLISTIWYFRAYKPHIFCKDMILATCQCQQIFCCWVEPSLLLSSFFCLQQ